MCFGSLFGGGGAKTANRIAKEQRADEVARQTRIRAGMGDIDRAFAGFGDDFYEGRARAYSDYAMPFVDRQLGDARKALIFALSRTGNLDSSAAIDENAELNRDANEARVGIANQGLDLANRTRGDVENARSAIVAQLNATGDASAASSAALREAQRLTAPQGFSPLGQLFANFMQGVSQIGANAGNGYAGFFGQRTPAYGYGGNGKGSQTIVRGRG